MKAMLVTLTLLVPVAVVAAQTAVLRVQPGDEATYLEQTTRRVVWSDGKETKRTGDRASCTITSLVLGRTDWNSDAWRLAQYRVRQNPESGSSWWLGLDDPFETGFDFQSVSVRPGEAKWTEQYAWPPVRLPAFARADISTGQQWEGEMAVGQGRAQMRCSVAGPDILDGRSCLRVEVTPVAALPCKVEESVMHEGRAGAHRDADRIRRTPLGGAGRRLGGEGRNREHHPACV